MTNRYENVSFLASDHNFSRFWKDYLSGNRRIKYVMGLGFDPRTVDCFAAIRDYMKSGSIDYKIIEYDDSATLDPKLGRMLERNTERLEALIPRDKWNSATIDTTDPSRDTSLAASNAVRQDELDGYTDLILDISAMPARVYFPIVRRILSWIDADKIRSPIGGRINMYLMTSENPVFDDAIQGRMIDDTVTYMHKFAARLHSQANSELPKVWIPLLGSGRSKQLNMIYRQVEGLVEFCPVFPMPSADPYRSRNLLVEHKELLMDSMGASPKDYVYCHESNPFDVCRKIYDTAKLYYDLFKPMGGCKIVISPMSNKLMCVGALLATCELLTNDLDAGVVIVAARGYDVADGAFDKPGTPVLHSLCLAGESYV